MEEWNRRRLRGVAYMVAMIITFAASIWIISTPLERFGEMTRLGTGAIGLLLTIWLVLLAITWLRSAQKCYRFWNHGNGQ